MARHNRLGIEKDILSKSKTLDSKLKGAAFSRFLSALGIRDEQGTQWVSYSWILGSQPRHHRLSSFPAPTNLKIVFSGSKECWNTAVQCVPLSRIFTPHRMSASNVSQLVYQSIRSNELTARESPIVQGLDSRIYLMAPSSLHLGSGTTHPAQRQATHSTFSSHHSVISSRRIIP